MEEADGIIPQQDDAPAMERENCLHHPIFLYAGKLAGKLDKEARMLSKGISFCVSKQLAILNLHKGIYAKNLLSTDILFFRKIVEKNPESATAQYHLGMALLNKTKLNEAIFHLKKAVFGNFHHIDAYLSLAQAYRKIGEPSKTIEVLEDAIARNPGSKETQDTLNSLRGTGSTTDQPTGG